MAFNLLVEVFSSCSTVQCLFLVCQLVWTPPVVVFSPLLSLKLLWLKTQVLMWFSSVLMFLDVNSLCMCSVIPRASGNVWLLFVCLAEILHVCWLGFFKAWRCSCSDCFGSLAICFELGLVCSFADDRTHILSNFLWPEDLIMLKEGLLPLKLWVIKPISWSSRYIGVRDLGLRRNEMFWVCRIP